MERKNGSWTIKGTEKIFANDFFKVSEDTVVRPDGDDGKYATIEFVEGVSVLPVDDENNIYITKQFRYALEREDFEVAAGAIEDGEEKLAAAKREAKEELGIEAEEWRELGRIEGLTSIAKSATYLFLARSLILGKPQSEATEEIEIVKLSLERALQMVESGEISHDLTVILILRAFLSYQGETPIS